MYYVGMKLCQKCKEKKNNESFNNDKTRKDGLYPYCKDCRRTLTNSKKLEHKIIGRYDGYIIVDDKRYPRILTENGAIRIHRYIMEKRLNRELQKGEVVHHIDGDKKNWSENNLILMKDKRHRVLEMRRIYGYTPKISCTTCGARKRYAPAVLKTFNLKMYQCKNCYIKDGAGGGRRKKLLKEIS